MGLNLFQLLMMLPTLSSLLSSCVNHQTTNLETRWSNLSLSLSLSLSQSLLVSDWLVIIVTQYFLFKSFTYISTCYIVVPLSYYPDKHRFLINTVLCETCTSASMICYCMDELTVRFNPYDHVICIAANLLVSLCFPSTGCYAQGVWRCPCEAGQELRQDHCFGWRYKELYLLSDLQDSFQRPLCRVLHC